LRVGGRKQRKFGSPNDCYSTRDYFHFTQEPRGNLRDNPKGCELGASFAPKIFYH